MWSCNILHGMKPTLVMILVQIVLALVNIGYKLSTADGMSLPVLVAYRFMFGAAFIVPVSILAERKTRPKLTKKTVFYAFLCGLFGGSLGQNLYLKTLQLTSATFVSAMINLVPAVTFIIAISLRLESLAWKKLSGKAKVLGTLIGIGGAMLFTFYKGSELKIWDTGINLLQITSTHAQTIASTNQSHHDSHHLIAGLFLGLASVASYSLWLIVQAKAAEKYPCPYSITGMMTAFAAIQSTGYALCVDHNWENWILRWDIRLLTVLIAGVIGSGIMFTLIAWCVRLKGPLFVSIFNPLLLLIVGIAGNLFLEEKLHLGMVFGGILIICGVYIVLWGKSKESKKELTKLAPETEDVLPVSTGKLPKSTEDSVKVGPEGTLMMEKKNGEKLACSEVHIGLYYMH